MAIKIQTHYIKYCLVSFFIGAIAAGIICGAIIYNQGKRIDEARADIQRVIDNESAVINRLESIENRLGTVANQVKSISNGLGEANKGIRIVADRISTSQGTIDTESGLIEEGKGILETVRARGPNIKK